ncbi:MAG: hypothetical protein L6Q99_15935 [Planctomycetes bacterium]|nr:hypothetical protein [Planctomycetota bacterium]
MTLPHSLLVPYEGPMAESEKAVATVSTFIAIVCTLMWFNALRRRPFVLRPTPWKRALQFAPATAIVGIFLVLTNFASHDVRGDVRYLYMYTVWGAAWIGVMLAWSPLLGLSLRDDVVERANPAAAAALWSLPFAHALAYVGGNIGDGPGWWVVLGSSGIAQLVLLVLVWTSLKLGHASESITIDRDTATGVRFAALVLAEALVLGRAVAGDWIEVAATVRDFADRGWPAFVLGAVGLVLDIALRPNASAPRRSVFAAGVVPGAVFLGAATWWLVHLGSFA